MNNMILDGMIKFTQEVRQDSSKAVKNKKVECSWIFEGGNPQMEAKLQFAKGEAVLQADSPPFMGGAGLAPDPVQYCLFGFATCFAGTLMAVATAMNVRIEHLKVSAENALDFRRSLGLSNDPIVQKVKLSLAVRTDAPDDKLKELERLARERCPGVYCVVNPIPLETEIIREP
jgi:uncharacterized OsmC-like protein